MTSPAAVDTPFEALKRMRQARLRRRIGDLEWWDVLYKVYVVGIIAVFALAMVGDRVKDTALDAAGAADFADRAPAVIGLVAAVLIAGAMRSGANGGPLSIEEADVRHLLEAPLPRRAVLRKPAFQRLRNGAFVGAVTGGAFGQFAGRRLPGSSAAWTFSGAAAGATVGVAAIAAAILVHVARNRWLPLLGVALTGLQAAAVWGPLRIGPLDTVGSLALWGWRSHAIDLCAPALAVAIGIASLLLLDRIRIEKMVRRSALVAQLRFAATMQDLRTITLLRRSLSLEQTRQRPLFPTPRFGSTMWRRGWQSIARFPVRRLLRMAALAAVAGAAQVAVWRGTTPAIAVAALAAFWMGLDAIEPFSQEADHPERHEHLPIERGYLLQRLLWPSFVLVVLLSLVGVATAWAIERTPAALATGLIAAPPAALLGALGGVANTMASLQDPSTLVNSAMMMPPEVAGMKNMVSTVWPVVISAIGGVPVLLAREAAKRGQEPLVAAGRAALFALVVIAGLTWWVRRRAQFKAWMAATVNDGRREAGLRPLT